MAELPVQDVPTSEGLDTVFDIECTACSQEGQREEAASYCLDCGEHMCAACVRYHMKLSSLKNHKLVDKHAVDTNKGHPKVLDACADRCPEHQSEIITLYCPDHNLTACAECVALNRTQYEHMIPIEVAAIGLQDRQEYTEFTAKLEDLTQQSEDRVTMARKGKQRSSDYHANALQELDAFEEEMVSTIRRNVEAFREEVRQIHGHDTEKMDKLASKGNKVLTQLQSMTTNVNDLKSKKHFCKLFVEMKQSEKTFTELQGNIADLKDDKVTIYTYQPDDDLRSMVARQDGLGKLVITDRDVAGDVRAMVATQEPDINVRSTNNRQRCTIPGMAVVDADKVAVTDSINNTIKLIDTTNNTILSEHEPRKMPWDVTTCEGDTIAVTCPLNKHILFLNHANGGLVHDRGISVNGDCRGIDSYDDKLYVAFDSEKKLEVMTTEGVVLQTFCTNAEGGQLFEMPSYLTVSAANKRIYVSEYMIGRVVILDMNGNQTGAYEDSEIRCPRQLAVTGSGVMFLSEFYTNTVHLLTPSGEKAKILLTEEDRVDGLYSACYCESTGRLFVGMNDCNSIKVFNISKP